MKHNVWRCQRGAMFGLDARIALAIFGGLSVVAGISVYGVISDTNTTALLAELDNISKARTNYIFDVGSEPKQFENLYSPTGSFTWKGPYMTMSSDKNVRFGGTYDFFVGRENGQAAVPPAQCDRSPGEVCASWVRLTLVPDEVAQALDEKVDSGDGNASGNLRIEPQPSDDIIYYKLGQYMRR